MNTKYIPILCTRMYKVLVQREVREAYATQILQKNGCTRYHTPSIPGFISTGTGTAVSVTCIPSRSIPLRVLAELE
jgi:hypothetical protein